MPTWEEETNRVLNVCIFEGRMKAKPELQNTKETGRPVCTFTIAVQRNVSRRAENTPTDWFQCVAWDKVAENITRFFDKGDKIIVQGRMQTRNWDDIKGNTRTATELIVREWEFGDAKKKKDDPTDIEADDFNDGDTPSRPKARRQARFTELDDSVDLPF